MPGRPPAGRSMAHFETLGAALALWFVCRMNRWRITRTLLLGGLVGSAAMTMGSGCSGDGDDTSEDTSTGESGGSTNSGGSNSDSGGSKNSGGSPSAGGQSSSGGSGSGALGGQGGEGGAGPDFPEPTCAATPEVMAGRNYGDYSVFAVRLDLDAPLGEYTIRVHSDDDGVAAVFLDDTQVDEIQYDPTDSLADNQDATLLFPDLFELDLRSTAQNDLSALDESIFDGCHRIIVREAPLVVEGANYGAFQVVNLVVHDDAAPGIYTFYAESGNIGEVELRLDGQAIDSLSYDWMTTVGGEMSFTFDFPGVVTFDIERPMGMSNLFALGDLLFDGRQELRVE